MRLLLAYLVLVLLSCLPAACRKTPTEPIIPMAVDSLYYPDQHPPRPL